MGWGGAHGESLLQSPVSLPIFVLLSEQDTFNLKGGEGHTARQLLHCHECSQTLMLPPEA